MKCQSFRPRLLLKSTGTPRPLLHALLRPRQHELPQIEPLTEASAAAQVACLPCSTRCAFTPDCAYTKPCCENREIVLSFPSIPLRRTLLISIVSQKPNLVTMSTLPLNTFLYIRWEKTIPNLKTTLLLLSNQQPVPSNPLLRSRSPLHPVLSANLLHLIRG